MNQIANIHFRSIITLNRLYELYFLIQKQETDNCTKHSLKHTEENIVQLNINSCYFK